MATPATALPSSVAYSTAAFRREHEADWAAFEQLLTRLERGSLSRFTEDDLLALPRLYRATLSSLSIARATILDAAGTDHARSVISKKYGIVGWVLVKASLIRRGKDGTIGIAITPR